MPKRSIRNGDEEALLEEQRTTVGSPSKKRTVCRWQPWVFAVAIVTVAMVVFLVNFLQLSTSAEIFSPLKDALIALTGAKTGLFLLKTTIKPIPVSNVSLLRSDSTTTTTFKPNPELNNKQKLIIFWTDFFGDRWAGHLSGFGGPTLPGSDDLNLNRTCYYTMDRGRLAEADAIVFHGRNFDFKDLPKTRLPSQHWCYYLMESPHHSGFTDSAWERAGQLGFNWTMTYHRLASVWVPYCHLEPLSPNEANRPAIEANIKRFSESFTKRPKDAAWFVSNCGTPSRREKLVEKLQERGIGVDSYGGCSGQRPDSLLKSMGNEGFFSRYRFYLSFENSLCEDYITEKFGFGFNASFYHGVIPIVYGSNDYSRIAPDGSYINAESFASVDALADHLKKLKENGQLASSYYQWHRLYKSVDFNFPRFGFTNLCKKLFTEAETNCRAGTVGERIVSPCQPPESIITDLRSLIGNCRAPKFF